MIERRTLAIVVLAVIAMAVAFVALTGEPSPERRGIQKTGNLVVIEMTTKQWRFDVLSANPAGSTKFSVNPPGEQFADPMITVRKGDTIVLRIKNLDVPHGFAIEEFRINVFTPPSEITEVRFVANEIGRFTFFCTVFCGTGHPNHKGTLIVEG